LVAQGQNFQGAGDVALSGADHVANFDLPGGLGSLIIDGDPALANLVSGQ
jgi:hypothetical protein